MTVYKRKVHILVKDGEEEVINIHFKTSDYLHATVEEAIQQGYTVVMTPTEECPYTHAHTRSWCGNPNCRKS